MSSPDPGLYHLKLEMALNWRGLLRFTAVRGKYGAGCKKSGSSCGDSRRCNFGIIF
jgi:hypothetical protein